MSYGAARPVFHSVRLPCTPVEVRKWFEEHLGQGEWKTLGVENGKNLFHFPDSLAWLVPLGVGKVDCPFAEGKAL